MQTTLYRTLGLGITPLFVFFLSLAQSLAQSPAQTSIVQYSQTDLTQKIKNGITHRGPQSFNALLQTWETQFGAQAFLPLIRIASDRTNEDSDRYIALMGASKIGGRQALREISKFLHDPCWMMRSGAIRVLTLIASPEAAAQIIPLLFDPALVVRSEAVEAIRVLKPKGSSSALVSTLTRDENFHGGKALWVARQALEALAKIQSRESVQQLVALLNHPLFKKDPGLTEQTLLTLKQITGKTYTAEE